MKTDVKEHLDKDKKIKVLTKSQVKRFFVDLARKIATATIYLALTIFRYFFVFHNY